MIPPSAGERDTLLGLVVKASSEVTTCVTVKSLLTTALPSEGSETKNPPTRARATTKVAANDSCE